MKWAYWWLKTKPLVDPGYLLFFAYISFSRYGLNIKPQFIIPLSYKKKAYFLIHTNYTFHIFAVFNTHHIFNDENKKTIRQYEIMINTLTSLRFIFAIMVFGAHCYVIDNVFNTHFFKEGFVGVSFFFVLSGFIIAYNYQEKLKDNKIDKRTSG